MLERVIDATGLKFLENLVSELGLLMFCYVHRYSRNSLYMYSRTLRFNPQQSSSNIGILEV